MIQNETLINLFIDTLGISRQFAKLLVNKGFKCLDSVKSFLTPTIDNLINPFSFYHMKEIVDLINKHIYLGSKIIIFGDYDCDGICSSAMLYLSFKKVGADVDVFLPDRIEDGYGLSFQAIDKIILKYQPQLIITVDCGIQSINEIDYVLAKGIDIVVTDHHEIGAKLPECFFLNPKAQDNITTELSGAGVVFFLLIALFDYEVASEYIDLCAIATIADMVPLIEDNRIITHHGLKKLNEKKISIGLNTLIENAFNKRKQTLKSSDIAYSLAPLLNATGRISSAYKSFNLLISQNVEDCISYTKEMIKENKLRQELCEKIFNQAKNKLFSNSLYSHKIIIIEDEEWEAGVLGIVASRLVELYKRPVILLSLDINGNYKGSCRSIKGINIYELLMQNSNLLENFGGHSMAAGVTIKKENLSLFKYECAKFLDEKYSIETYWITNEYDYIFNDVSEITTSLAKEIQALEPCGAGNTSPIFCVISDNFNFSRISSYNHIKQRINQKLEFIAFNFYEHIKILNSCSKKEVYFTISLEEFRYNQYVLCNVKSYHISELKFNTNELLFSDLLRYISISPSNIYNSLVENRDLSFGTVALIWQYSTYYKYIDSFQDFIRSFNKLYTYSSINTVVLSPNLDINLHNFSTIIIYDDPPTSYINYIKLKYPNKEIFVRNRAIPLQKFIKLEQLANTFDFIYNNIHIFNEYSNLQEIMSSEINSITIDNNIIKVAILILSEINAISFEENIGFVINTKTPKISNSTIYKLLSLDEVDGKLS